MRKTFAAVTCAVMTCALCATAAPALAQDSDQPPVANERPSDPDGVEPSDLGSLIEEGAQGLLGDLFREVAPHMDAIGRELSLGMHDLAPMLDELGRMMDDIRNYQAPERLQNGDILIRRKPGAPPPPEVSPRFQDLFDRAPDNPGPTKPGSTKPGPTKPEPAPDGMGTDRGMDEVEL